MHSSQEQAIVRIHFIDPDGHPQQSTVHTTWHAGTIRRDLLAGRRSQEATHHSDVMTECMHTMFGRMNCQVVRIDFLANSTREYL